MSEGKGEARASMAAQEADGAMAERDMRDIVESGSVLLWVGSPDGKRRWVGHSLAKLTGLARESLVGEGWIDALHPEDVERCIAIDRICLAVDRRFTLDYRLRCHDGRYIWMMDSGEPCHAPSGEFRGHVGVVVDIDERRLVEDQLAERLQTKRSASRI